MLEHATAPDEETPSQGILVPREHPAFDGIPWYDEELQVAQTTAHRLQVVELASILGTIAPEANVMLLADEPIWYNSPENDVQKAFYGDCVLSQPIDTRRITAESLLLAIEVVSVHDRRKEYKDTRFQRLMNEYNGVPEFALVFPELSDPRSLTWCRLVDGLYEEHLVVPGGRVESMAVPGLAFGVRRREDWSPGGKLEVWYRGQRRLPLAEERARAEQEKARAEQEKARAAKLADHLRSLGIDPDSIG